MTTSLIPNVTNGIIFVSGAAIGVLAPLFLYVFPSLLIFICIEFSEARGSVVKLLTEIVVSAFCAFWLFNASRSKVHPRFLVFACGLLVGSGLITLVTLLVLTVDGLPQ